MDNDPSQNSAPSHLATEEVQAKLHCIPSHSPDLNVVKNVFNVVRGLLEYEATSCNITHET